MNRLAVALAPLVLAASAFSAQAQDPHAGHTMPATAAPTRPAPAPRPTPQAPARPAQDPHAGHVMPPAQTLDDYLGFALSMQSLAALVLGLGGLPVQQVSKAATVNDSGRVAASLNRYW